MFCNSATHARWIPSESDPADALARQTWTDAAPCEEGLTTKARITPAHFWPRRALPRRATLYRTSLSYSRSIVFIYDMEHGVVSVQACEAPLRSKRRANHPTIIRTSSLVDGAHLQLCSTTLPIRGTNGYGDDRFLRPLETVCAHDYDRLFHATRDSANCSRRCSTPCGRQERLFRSQLCTRSRRTRPLGLRTSLSTTKHSTALRREPTEPSSPRHGGASHDALTDHRNLAQIKTREQWRADCPVQRYKRTTRLLQRVAVLVPRRWHPD